MRGPLNARQIEVLRWIAQDCPAGQWPPEDHSYKVSAVALQSRGLVRITRRAKSWAATITEAGSYYLEHGSYPPVPHTREKPAPTPVTPTRASERPALKQARALIRRLQEEGTVTIIDPDETTRARYRRALHACRAHHLVPEGQELRFTGRDSGDIIIKLAAPSSAAQTDWNRIRLNTRRITTNLDALRAALETSTVLDQLSEHLRPRAIAFLIDLAEILRTTDNTKLKTPKLFIQIGTRRRDVLLTEIVDEIPHKLTPHEARELRRAPWKQFPKHDQIRSGLLRLQVMRDGSREIRTGNNYWSYEPNSDQFSDQARKPLEKQVREIALAIKKGVDDDIAARELAEQRQAEAQAEYERKRAQERATWEGIRRRAREKALLQLREATFAHAFQNWQQAEELRTFADRLESAAGHHGMLSARPRLQQWLTWARDRAAEIDPIENLADLDDDVFDAEPSADSLRPHMEGWDPNAPQKDYSSAYRKSERQTAYLPERRPWHPGMANKPTWWR